MLFAAMSALAQPAKQLDDFLQTMVTSHQFNGTVLVARGGEVILQKGYGYRDAEKKLPNDGESVFQVGSITKQITAAVIMQLQEEGKLSVSDRLDKYFKGFPNGDRITIEHLLTHTSGLHNYTDDTAIMKSDVTRSYPQAQLMAIFRRYPADFAPGSKWSYSNTAYSLLGYLIEEVEKKPYEQVVRERILGPLGMTRSGFDFTHLQSANKTKGYFGITDDNAFPAPIVDSTIAFSAGALYSTVGDLYKWERAVSAGRLLKPASWKAVFTPVKNHYGYGWGIDSLYGRTTTAHSGGIHGYASYILRFPEDNTAIIVFDNSSGKAGLVARGLAALLFNQAPQSTADRKVLKLEPALLQQYVGEYEFAPTFSIRIFLEDGQLKAQATNQPSFELFAEKENAFFLKVVDARVAFIRDANGTVNEMILYQNGQSPHGKKVK